MNLSCTPLATTGITTVNNVGAIDTYGGAASLTVKPIDSLTITPRIMLQRTDVVDRRDAGGRQGRERFVAAAGSVQKVRLKYPAS